MGYELRDNPCKNCTKRSLGCHARCKDYQNWNKGYHKLQKEEMKERIVSSGIREVKANGVAHRAMKSAYHNGSKTYRMTRQGD